MVFTKQRKENDFQVLRLSDVPKVISRLGSRGRLTVLGRGGGTMGSTYSRVQWGNYSGHLGVWRGSILEVW